MSGSLPKKGYFIAALLVGALVTLMLAAITLPLILHRSSLVQDGAAKDLLLDVGSRMASCARGGDGEGSYAGCRASEMEKAEPGIAWRDGVAPHGWGEGRVGRVYVSELGEESYRLETTSGSGRVFSYAYNGNGAITRRAGGGGYESDW